MSASIETLLSVFAGHRVLVIGDLMLDHYIWGDVQRISPEAPVPVVLAQRETHVAGGAANVAMNLAALQADVAIAGTIGTDSHGDQLLELFDSANIRMELVQRRSSRPTIRKTRVIARTQQLCRIDQELGPSSYALEIDSLDSSRLITYDAIILSDYAKGTISQRLLDHLSELCGSITGSPTLLALDPKPSRKLAHRGIGLMTPNRHEALQLAGLPEPAIGETYPLAEICRAIHAEYQPRLLVVTLGADGMAISQAGEITSIIPTRAREIFDVSGAGDTVIASLTLALAAGADSTDAAIFANLAAGVVVSKVGTATATPLEILQFEEKGRTPHI